MMLHWFNEAQFDANGNFIYTYFGLGDYIATIGFIFCILLVLFKFGLTFRHYIYTGSFGEADRGLLTGIMEGRHISKTWRYLFTGYHPGAIAADMCLLWLVSIMSVFLWGVLLVGVLIVGLAYTMRKRIAHKQNFVSNLKGEQLEQ